MLFRTVGLPQKHEFSVDTDVKPAVLKQKFLTCFKELNCLQKSFMISF